MDWLKGLFLLFVAFTLAAILTPKLLPRTPVSSQGVVAEAGVTLTCGSLEEDFEKVSADELLDHLWRSTEKCEPKDLTRIAIFLMDIKSGYFQRFPEVVRIIPSVKDYYTTKLNEPPPSQQD